MHEPLDKQKCPWAIATGVFLIPQTVLAPRRPHGVDLVHPLKFVPQECRGERALAETMQITIRNGPYPCKN